MTYSELVKNTIAKNEDDYRFFGVRFEKKVRQIGDICENSKSNFNRDDSRDFPEYGTCAYDAMVSLNGTCAYDAEYWERYIDVDDCAEEGMHVYLVAGDSYSEGEDMDEMIIESAVVLAVIC